MCKENDVRNRFSDEELTMFQELYRENYELLLRFAAIVMDTQDYGKAEEIVQEVFYEALGSIKEISTLKNPSGWLLETIRLKLRNIEA